MGDLVVVLVILLNAAIVIVPFTLEFNRWEKKGGKNWMGKFFLTLGLVVFVPIFVVIIIFELHELFDFSISGDYWLVIPFLLAVITYLTARKFIK